ncbi:MAG: hypothetical protein COT15_02185 [Candidatus Diapherotrites archaeon CG08_land_8_20_14_0_20_34_12]|nr:MAG: hypothetical protein COT15_02185 [Candidatus Diapherotrites archaeon CG08_land_8_20_14_0_20_34_12]
MIFYFAAIAFLISLLALIYASYTDLKQRIVPDFLSYGLIVFGIILAAIESVLLNDWIYFGYSAFAAIYGFIFALILYRLGLWAGGDVKLFTGIAALNPINVNIAQYFGLGFVLFNTINLPIFPINFFILSIFSMLPYGAFLIFTKINKTEFFKEELQKSKNLVFYGIFLSGLSYFTIIFKLNYFIALFSILLFGLIDRKNKVLSKIIAILCFIFAFYGSNYSIKLILDSLIIIVSIFLFILIFSLLSSGRKVLKKKVKIENLEEGMIPANNVLIENNSLRFEESLNIKSIINYIKHNQMDRLKEKIEAKDLFASSNKACGFTQEQILKLKEIARNEEIKEIEIKESAPMVPAMLLAYIILNIIGDLLWHIIIA